MRSNLGASKADKRVASVYSILSKSIKKKCIIRDTILDLIGTDVWEKMVSKLEGVEDKFHSFMTLLYADNILWDEVIKVENLGDGHEAYDITVPDSLVFMVSNGLIIYDTFGIHVPATEEANREAEKMLTSNNLYRPGNMRDKMSPELSKEYMMGIYKLTRNGRTTSKNYQFVDYALRDAQQKKIKWDDIISIRRIGRTTAGKIRAMQKVPDDMKNYQITLDAKAQEKFLIDIEKKHGKKVYMDVIEDWKHAGRIHVYQDGSSLLLSDMQSLSKERNQLYRKADMDAARIRANKSMSEEEKEAKIIDIYSKVDSKIIGMAVKLPNNAAGKSNNISDMVNGGLSKPGPNQLKQMVGHLGLMMDHQNKVMPEPIRGNYSEGLSSSEFFQHMYAQRKGMIDKSQEVSGPGMLSKELTNSATTQKVTMVDCGTKNGRLDNVDRHLLDRITAEAVAGVPSGTIVDQDVLGKLQKSGKPKIKMRSILTCEAPQGICAKCFGLDEHGSLPYIGKNIGVSEIQAITERSVQLPMKSFHCIKSGSTVWVKSPYGKILNPTHEELFFMMSAVPVAGDDWEEKFVADDWKIWDIDGWTTLKKIGRHKRNSPMVAVKSKSGHVLVCQANHPIMVRNKIIQCKDCGSSDLAVASQRDDSFYVRCNNCDNTMRIYEDSWTDFMPVMVEAGEVTSDNFVNVGSIPPRENAGYKGLLSPYLLGMFVAEGSFTIRKDDGPQMNKKIQKGNVKRGGRSLTNLTFSQNDGEIKDKILKDCLALGLPASSKKRVIRVNSKELATELINQTGHGCCNKRLPMDFISLATDKELGCALSGIIDGDGCIVTPKDQNSSFIQVDTTSTALLSQIKTICDILEIRCNPLLSKVRKMTNYQGYTIRIYPSRRQCQELLFESIKVKPEQFYEKEIFDDHSISQVAQVKETYQEEDEWVYDVTTESGTFYSAGVWNHNTGGVASADKGTANAFDRALQILRMPDNIKNKATLAERSGQVMNIKKSGYGGFIVNINGMDHKVPKGLGLKVKEGQMVQKGDALSDGLVKPQELLKLRGIDAVQDQMRSDLNDAFSSAGVKLHTRTYEVPVKMLTENVRITDPGDSPDFIAGDRTTKPKVEAWNRANIGKRPIKYTHELAGSLYAPLQSDDWARRMALNRISGTLQEGAALGYTSDRKGVSPFADIVLGPGTRLPNK
ncbi:MAG: hypothetical protein ACR2MS_07870 [Weeksellaceae bacterium]